MARPWRRKNFNGFMPAILLDRACKVPPRFGSPRPDAGGWIRGSIGDESAGHVSVLQRLADELEQRFGGRIIRQAKVGIDLVVGRLFGAEGRDRNAGCLQHVGKPLRLRARVWMVG